MEKFKLERPYNVSRFQYFLVEAENLLSRYGRNLNYCPEPSRHMVYEYYRKAYAVIYSYVYTRIASKPNIDINDRDDIRQSMFAYLVGRGSGFFHRAKMILNSHIEHNEKFRKIQNILDLQIFLFWCRFIEKEESYRVIYEEDLDPQYLEDLKRQSNPEDIVIMKDRQRRLVDALLTAPPECRIDIRKYETFAKEYIKSIYGKSTNFNTYYSRDDRAKFTCDYVIYSIRKQLDKHHIQENDIFESYTDPTFNQLLTARLGVNPEFVPQSIKEKYGKSFS